MSQESKYIDSFQILKEWRDSDVNTWPECLHNFWFKIYDYKSAQTYIKNIKKYYSEDQDLLDFASWLKKNR
jgi:hypothetical protein